MTMQNRLPPREIVVTRGEGQSEWNDREKRSEEEEFIRDGRKQTPGFHFGTRSEIYMSGES